MMKFAKTTRFTDRFSVVLSVVDRMRFMMSEGNDEGGVATRKSQLQINTCTFFCLKTNAWGWVAGGGVG